MLQLLGMLALEEANTLLTPRPPAEGYNPKVTEGMCFALHPISFSLLGYIYLRVFLPGTVYLMVFLFFAPTESKRNAIETLLKASSYFECAISGVLPNVPEEIR